MKSLLTLLIGLLVSASTFAASCNMVIPWPPGGTSDINARVLQKGNPDIRIEYKPGAFAASAIQHINANTDTFLLSPAHMFSSKNPDKNLDIDFLRPMYSTNLTMISATDVTVDQLLTKKVTLGIPALGTIHHAIALELKEKNNLINIIPTKGDATALPMIINKDIDLYISASPTMNIWMTQQSTIKKVIDLPFNKEVKLGDLVIKNYLFQGIFVSKKASLEARNFINDCLDKSLNTTEFKSESARLNLNVPNLTTIESSDYFNRQIEMLRKYGL
jgi:tripartite-type tricarboxylate transporter receptor subunit TctC